MGIRKRWSPKSRARTAPQRPGVYELASRAGKTLYIGRSRNISERLRTQLSDPAVNGRVGKVRWQESTGPTSLEKKLLTDFKQRHGQLPPLNDQLPR